MPGDSCFKRVEKDVKRLLPLLDHVPDNIALTSLLNADIDNVLSVTSYEGVMSLQKATVAVPHGDVVEAMECPNEEFFTRR